MSQRVMLVEKERFLLNDDSKYMITGKIPKEAEIECYMDGTRLTAEINTAPVMSVVMRAVEVQNPGGKWAEVLITLPENLEKYKKLEAYAVVGGQRTLWYKVKTAELLKKRGKPQFFVDRETVHEEQKMIVVTGWAAGKTQLQLKVYDENKNPLKTTVKWTTRMDVAEMFRECEVGKDCGFHLRAENISGKKLYLVVQDEEKKKAVYRIGLSKVERLKAKADIYSKKAVSVFRANGISSVLQKSVNKIRKMRQGDGLYHTWLKENPLTKQELKRQRQAVFKEDVKFSLVVPLYKTEMHLLKALIESVQAQTYSNWELCLSDGSGADSPIRKTLEEYQKKDPRIKVVFNDRQLQISENTNAAIRIATGNYIAFADHDDTLSEEAFYQMAMEIASHPEAELLYSDEDIIDIKGRRLYPHFKSDYNPELLCCVNYICHLVVVKKDLLDRTGLLRPEYNGSQDYDFLLRCTEHTKSENIRHIPKILYHWRSHEGSTAGNPDDKPYAVIAGEKALARHYERLGIKASVEYTGCPVVFRTHFEIQGEPKVSILIPNKDHTEDLDKCVTSIMEKSTWKNIQIVVIENNSEKEETFQYYEELEKRYPNVKVVKWEGPFNYSAINNFGAKYADGDYFLLLNNDTEVITPDWLESMLGYCQREEVGIVGAKLLYPDNTVQHAGVVVGIAGFAGHILTGYDRNAVGYLWRLITTQDESAVTGACLMVKRSVFEELRGLDESFAVALNDIDFCLRAGALGKKVVFTPDACLYHYESKSRGLENTPEKKERFQKEVAHFRARHAEFLKAGDPYYNPNLSIVRGDCAFRMASEKKDEVI
ncbi:MAG: glycosyltransferase family 2 protein [Clostridia bacterium]|nr:glycosyltransferase family 2 protein [Clostridia bacterium]